MKKNNLWSSIRQYGSKSVFYRYITSSFTISLLVFIPFTLVIFIYYDYAILASSVLIDEIYNFSFLNGQSISSRETITLGDNNYYEWYRTYRSARLPFLMFHHQN